MNDFLQKILNEVCIQTLSCNSILTEVFLSFTFFGYTLHIPFHILSDAISLTCVNADTLFLQTISLAQTLSCYQDLSVPLIILSENFSLKW